MVLRVLSFNQGTGAFLQTEEVQEAVAYIKTYQDAAELFNAAMNGELPADAAQRSEMLQRYSKAGATWWLELEADGESFGAYRNRIRKGLQK